MLLQPSCSFCLQQLFAVCTFFEIATDSTSSVPSFLNKNKDLGDAKPHPRGGIRLAALSRLDWGLTGLARNLALPSSIMAKVSCYGIVRFVFLFGVSIAYFMFLA